MRRDMDLARAILLALEKCDRASGLQELAIEHVTPDQVTYHVKLLAQAGLIEAQDASGANHFEWFPVSLTWAGHEFLDAARNDSLWHKAKKIAVEKTGSLMFEVLKDVLLQLLRQSITTGFPT